jgi:ATP-dependent helicase HepA
MFPSRQLPAGHCLLECSFDVLVQSELFADCRPFLPALNVRTLALDISDKDLSDALPETALEKSLQSVKRQLARSIIASKKEEIPQWFKKCEAFAEAKKQQVVAAATDSAQAFYHSEIARLQRLKQRNPLADEAEIDALSDKSRRVAEAVEQHLHLHLSAIRLIVITEG